LQAEDLCSSMENDLFEIYDSQRPLIDDKLQQLYDTLGRIDVLEEEIKAFNKSLSCFFQDTIIQSSP